MTLLQLTADEWRAIALSLQVAAAATAGSLPLGIAIAWLLARRNFWGKALLETLINLPLVLPPVVTGYLLLVTFGRRGWIGQWLDRVFDFQVVFTWKAAALASAVMAFPFMVRSIRLAIASIDVGLEQAARTLGAGPLDTFVTITLPLARDGIIAGCVLAFARSIGEFGATIMVSGSIPGETRTIPLEIYSLIESPGGAEQARSLVVASVLIAAAAIAAGEFLERRGRQRLTAR
jgi:molybdate transport system permease protein